MARIICQAVIMGEKSGTGSTFRFEIDDDYMARPADEIVEALMEHLHEIGYLRDRYGYELNSAMRNEGQGVIMAMGNLFLSNQPLPFTAFISREVEANQ